MIALIDWILDLFRSEDAARAFVAAPEQAMRDAGLAGVSAAQLSSVAATAVPGMVLGGGDPILGLQRAVANQYGFAPAYTPAYTPSYTPSYDPVWNSSPSFAPAPTFAPQTDLASNNSTELASRNATELASHNDVPLFSPTQDAGANAQQGAFNLGFGDITLGSKTTQTATDGGVVVGADANGDIVSGDGAVLGNDNAVTNGGIRADHGSNISTGRAAVIDDSGTTAGGDAIATADSGSVIKGADNSLHNGASVGGSATTTTVGGTGNSTTADGRETTLTTVTTTTMTDNSDNSAHETTLTDASTTDSSHHSLFETSLLSDNETALHSDLGLRSDPSFASGDRLLGLGF